MRPAMGAPDLLREESVMFANTKASSGFAVDDMSAAQAFYGEKLGLRTGMSAAGVVKSTSVMVER